MKPKTTIIYLMLPTQSIDMWAHIMTEYSGTNQAVGDYIRQIRGWKRNEREDSEISARQLSVSHAILSARRTENNFRTEPKHSDLIAELN